MTSARRLAEPCLVALCGHVSALSLSDENMDMWLSMIRDVLPDCEECAEALTPLRVAAWALAHATNNHDRENAMTRVRWETKRYFAVVASHRFEQWKEGREG